MWKKIEHTVSVSEVKTAYKKAMHSMACLNKNAAKLMHKYNAHCSTDVTGFGILGHAKNLVLNQKEKVSFVINKLPILANMAAVYKSCGINFKLLEGYSAETSGIFTISSIIFKIAIFHFVGALNKMLAL